MNKKELQQVPEKMILEEQNTPNLNQKQQQQQQNTQQFFPEQYQNLKLDYKQYSFAPLLLYSDGDYFDKGFSNYNSVEEFYRSLLIQDHDVDMLLNVVYERKNMKYDELCDFCFKNKVMIVCCIEEHFTALVILNNEAVLYYDPQSPTVKLIYNKESCQKFVVFHLMKCKYGDQTHVSEHKDYYMENSLRKFIYSTWKNLMDMTVDRLYSVDDKKIKLDLNEYLFINNSSNPQQMSTQLTGNTCYFQTYLFCLICRVCEPSANKSSSSVQMKNVEIMKNISIQICEYTLKFYQGVDFTRPYNNCNFICDYYRYKNSAYYQSMLKFVEKFEVKVDYEQQYQSICEFLKNVPVHQQFNVISSEEKMPSSLNTKQLQHVTDTANAREKLCLYNYYKYRPANMTFGFNTNIMRRICGFNEFNGIRKNFLLGMYEQLKKTIQPSKDILNQVTKYRDYYFMPQYEVGQQELIDLHFYTYLLDWSTSKKDKGDLRSAVQKIVSSVNSTLLDQFKFSTQKQSSYEKIMPQKDFCSNKENLNSYLNYFMSIPYFKEYCALGFNEFNPKEKEINCLTQSVFYDTELMRRQMFRMEYEFERECINQMAKSTLQKYMTKMDHIQDQNSKYEAVVKIGQGITYSKYNNLLHFVNVVDNYWQNPDINSVNIFGKDIRNLLGFLCQKIIFSDSHNFYHYGHVESEGGYYKKTDLLVASENDFASPLVSLQKRDNKNILVLSDRVYEFNFIKNIVDNLFKNKKKQLKSDDEIINFCLLHLVLDFGLYEKYGDLLNISFLFQGGSSKKLDKKQLQIHISNTINEMDKANKEAIQRQKVENLINECSYKFIVNANFNINSLEFKIINMMNSDQVYHPYIVLCKIYMSLCQINKSVELDYYKVKCDDSYKIIIPINYSHATSEYLDQITHNYNFYEENNFICYDNMKFFDISQSQPEIQLHKMRLKSKKPTESMYRYVEISNTFELNDEKDVFFVAGNILVFRKNVGSNNIDITVNNIPIEYDLMCVNEAISLIPCFKYADNQYGKSDITLMTSPHMYYHVDTAGQFNENYYGMKFELIEHIKVKRSYVDLNDQYQFHDYKLSELLTESKTVLYYPHYLVQPQSQDQLISLIDLALKFRNISFFLYTFAMFQRTAIALDFIIKENKTIKITGPWFKALRYIVRSDSPNQKYTEILSKQFFHINQFKDLGLTEFIEEICKNFTKYQKHLDDDQPQIVPTQKQKNFIKKIIEGKESFYFSEVGSGKTKVILPILCQMFLSNNYATHLSLAKKNKDAIKNTLFVIVPEHLVLDAQSQVFRYCLNLNFKQNYKIYDDVFNLLEKDVEIEKDEKKIFISSFNQFKKALTYDKICKKLYNNRDNIQLIIDEVDDFLDRDKLVFNICQNKNNSFEKKILEQYYSVANSVYQDHVEKQNSLQSENIPDEQDESEKTKYVNQSSNGQAQQQQQQEEEVEEEEDIQESKIQEEQPKFIPNFQNYNNPPYWTQLYNKYIQINEEIQLKSKSINKSFGIFNEQTLKHCKNIAHDIEGYKCLIARPYESVNRGMSGSYYSDVERTIFLTYYILMEDTEKYNDLFQLERKNITFEFFMEYIQKHHLDYDELIYGRNSLSLIIQHFPKVKHGLVKYLFEIILRKMEIHDKSRSVNSIDVLFNFDCTGFTGTPFIDNYPNYQYIKSKNTEKIPDLIYRSFYLHSNSENKDLAFKNKFVEFQGDNNHVYVKYEPSDFIQNMDSEAEILESIFKKHLTQEKSVNAIVDLCGIFKRINMHGVRNVLRQVYGTEKFKYIYYINQVNCSDRILHIENDNDVQYDEEFYKYLVDKYGDKASEKIFFYIDNRNVIGKDIPFQLIFKKKFEKPLIYKSVVVAHDVEDFSKIWQAMGRSRTMNLSKFVIYKNALHTYLKGGKKSLKKYNTMEIEDIQSGKMSEEDKDFSQGGEFKNMQNCDITKELYIKNCDKKVTGNISSIYQTLISIFNISQKSFYYNNEIINIFILKMDGSINKLLDWHVKQIINDGFKITERSNIFQNILLDKFSTNSLLAKHNSIQLNKPEFLRELISQIIHYKFEQKEKFENEQEKSIFYLIVRFLSGDMENQMEVSYTKQQQKQKQNQMNKNQDSDTMQSFSKDKQLEFSVETDDYFAFTKLKNDKKSDILKDLLNFPILDKEICIINYKFEGQQKQIRVFPTVQFLYSLFINPHYIQAKKTDNFIRKGLQKDFNIEKHFLDNFIKKDSSNNNKKSEKMEIENSSKNNNNDDSSSSGDSESDDLQEKILQKKKSSQQHYQNIQVEHNFIRHNPQFNIACVGEGIFILGMKNQFSSFDLEYFGLKKHIAYVCDETSHILYNNENCENKLGQNFKKQNNAQRYHLNPYNLDLYIFLDQVTKQELANNVVTSYYKNTEALLKNVDQYNGEQGDGFICWRFIMRQAQQEKQKKQSIYNNNNNSNKKSSEQLMEDEN